MEQEIKKKAFYRHIIIKAAVYMLHTAVIILFHTKLSEQLTNNRFIRNNYNIRIFNMMVNAEELTVRYSKCQQPKGITQIVRDTRNFQHRICIMYLFNVYYNPII